MFENLLLLHLIHHTFICYELFVINIAIGWGRYRFHVMGEWGTEGKKGRQKVWSRFGKLNITLVYLLKVLLGGKMVYIFIENPHFVILAVWILIIIHISSPLILD